MSSSKIWVIELDGGMASGIIPDKRCKSVYLIFCRPKFLSLDSQKRDVTSEVRLEIPPDTRQYATVGKQHLLARTPPTL